jgi:hypothetical protein
MAMDFGGAYLMFAGKFGGDLTKQELKEHSKLDSEGCAKGSKILTYTLEIKTQGKVSIIQSDSDQLSKDALATLRSLEKGDEFIFKNMKAKLPTGSTVDVMGRKFIVV